VCVEKGKLKNKGIKEPKKTHNERKPQLIGQQRVEGRDEVNNTSEREKLEKEINFFIEKESRHRIPKSGPITV